MFKRGSVVVSRAGKDKAGFLAIVQTENGIYVADGKRRPLERPKRKNPRHLAETGITLAEGDMATNRGLRRALSAVTTTADVRTESSGGETPTASPEGG